MEKVFLWPDGPRVYDNRDVFSIGTDAVMLGEFVGRCSGLAADLGCGSGVVGLSIAWRNPNVKVNAVDIQMQAVEATSDNITLNQLDDRMTAHCIDLREMVTPETADKYDLVVSNPPYYPLGSGKQSFDAAKAIARTEICCTLHDVCVTAAGLLKTGGRFCIVHKPERLAELIVEMHNVKIEPKRLRLVFSRMNAAPSLILVEGRRGAKPGLLTEPPYIIGESR